MIPKRLLNILKGSVLGITAGLMFFGLAKLTGLDLSGNETSLLITIPSMLGVLTSYLIF